MKFPKPMVASVSNACVLQDEFGLQTSESGYVIRENIQETELSAPTKDGNKKCWAIAKKEYLSAKHLLRVVLEMK